MGKFGLGCLKLRHKTNEVSVLDYRHCSLDYIPSDVFTHERTLEELHVDANQISELPRVSIDHLFDFNYCSFIAA